MHKVQQVLEVYAYALDLKASPHPSTINDLEVSMNLRIILAMYSLTIENCLLVNYSLFKGGT